MDGASHYVHSSVVPQMISLFLIGLVIAARTLAYNYTNIPLLIGMAVVASFLFVVAVVGLVGACKHHQVILFFVSFCRTGSELYT